MALDQRAASVALPLLECPPSLFLNAIRASLFGLKKSILGRLRTNRCRPWQTSTLEADVHDGVDLMRGIDDAPSAEQQIEAVAPKSSLIEERLPDLCGLTDRRQSRSSGF
jgi:hypothetical protein